jgi:cleavage stimulation factor subunit 3
MQICFQFCPKFCICGITRDQERLRLSVLRVDLEALESRINSANSSLSSISTTASASNPPPTTEVGVPSTNSSFATQASDEKPPKSKELSERRTEYGVVWIMYMRFGRRAEGLQSSRSIFSRARKDCWTPWEVFEAAGAINPLRTRVTL